ncbi:TPA: hypothetical protein DCZ39_07180 [Patescibacteria group bacterium]|nr:hypothetical protein [Candidatus Gracilibacteria bacterium]
MDFNNAAASNKSDQILSILEAGEGSSIARDQLDQFLHNYIELQGHTPTYNRAALRQCLSIKEKVALIAAEMYINTTGVNPTSIEDIRDVEMRITLDETIRHIEEELINNRDFTESWILRNAAMNRFQCELSVSETNELNEIGKKTKELCTTNGLDALAESTHFTNESDAQKIMKLSDILRQISASGVVVNDTVLKGFEKFDKKIEPLRTLDKHYEHVTKTLNMLHRVAQKGYHAAIKPQQQKKLDEVLAKTDMLKTVNDAFTNFNTVDNFSKNEEHGFLENLLAQIKASPKYKETLSSISISDAEFNERFISSSAFALMERARLGLHSQK